MQMNKNYTFIVTTSVIFVCILVFALPQLMLLYKPKQNPHIVAWVINMDKNVERFQKFFESYALSDLNAIPVMRLSAIKGDDIDASKVLSPKALREMNMILQTGYRTHHYQIASQGAIGCYLSHLKLYQQLLNSSCDAFLIFEDDANIPPTCLQDIADGIQHAPYDWDVILFGHVHLTSQYYNDKYDRVNGFWGTHAYAINVKGAHRFMQQYKKYKIDAQIDLFLAYLSQKKLMNIYAYKPSIFTDQLDYSSDIQKDDDILDMPNVNPYAYRGIII